MPAGAQTQHQLLLPFPLAYQEMAAKSHLTFDLGPGGLYRHRIVASSTHPPNSSRRHTFNRATCYTQQTAQCFAHRVAWEGRRTEHHWMCPTHSGNQHGATQQCRHGWVLPHQVASPPASLQTCLHPACGKAGQAAQGQAWQLWLTWNLVRKGARVAWHHQSGIDEASFEQKKVGIRWRGIFLKMSRNKTNRPKHLKKGMWTVSALGGCSFWLWIHGGGNFNFRKGQKIVRLCTAIMIMSKVR